jgi:hypothetical protein
MSRSKIATTSSIVLLSLASIYGAAQAAPRSYPSSTQTTNSSSSSSSTYQLCKVCAQWASANTPLGTGDCIRYVYQPCSSPVRH